MLRHVGELGTRGSSSARKRRSKFRKSGQSASACRCRADCATLPSSIWAFDSKLRACDLVKLRVRDVCHGDRLAARTIVLQQKTQLPVQFEITAPTREALEAWIKSAGLKSDSFLFPSRVHESPHLGTRQYARIVHECVEEIGLDPTANGTHSMRRTKPTLIYRRTKNIRAVQLLLGHSKLESTVRYLGIDVDDALEIAEQTEV